MSRSVGYIVNFGWIFARPSEATIKLFQAAFDAYVARNEWDVRPSRLAVFILRMTSRSSAAQQLLLSNTIINQGGKEWRGEKGDEHWWIVEPLGTRINMLPLDKVRSVVPSSSSCLAQKPVLSSSPPSRLPTHQTKC